MHLTLIMPGVGRKPGEPYLKSWMMEPLGPAVLAALTPPDVEVRFIDDRLAPIPYDDPTDLVAISVETYTARRAYAIAAGFRLRGVPVVLGGYHPTLAPDEAADHADVIVEGPAEAIWPTLLTDVKHGRLQQSYRAGENKVAFGLHPRRSIFAGKKYLPVTLIESNRGCHAACDFCSVSPFYRRTRASRPIRDVIAEIEAAGRHNVFFVDDNIVADPAQAKELFAALRATGIRWMSQGSVTMAADPALMRLMRESGCRGMLIGFESLSARTLSLMNKCWNQAEWDYADAVSRIRDAGIAIYATFVLGYDLDDAATIDRTLEFALRQKFFLTAFNHLVPFPGTPLYQRLRKEGRLLADPWWLNPNYRFGDVAFQPALMSAEELADRCRVARAQFYHLPSVFARATDLRANCPSLLGTLTYFWVNLFSAREMRLRQGLPLGAGFEPNEDFLGSKSQNSQITQKTEVAA